MSAEFRGIGVDGCPAGWFFVALEPNGSPRWGVVSELAEVVQQAGESDRIFVDIPIGLPKGAEGRECDRVARGKLGHRRNSVFSAPVRAVLDASDYEDAKRRSLEATCPLRVQPNAEKRNLEVTCRAINKQAFAIVPKIREVDALLQGDKKARRLVREVHPEICFWALNGRKPMKNSKKTEDGFCERREVLKHVRPSADREVDEMLSCFKRKDVGRDDVVDAMAAAVTASVDEAALQTLPSRPTRDSVGLPMEMVFAEFDDAIRRGSEVFGHLPGLQGGTGSGHG